MVRKRASFKQLLAYIMKPHAELSSKERKKLVYKHNLHGSTQGEWLEQFRLNETFRKYKRKDSNKLMHEVIAFHPKDSRAITDEFLRSFMHHYASIRCDRPMYVATVHREGVDHVHLHICLSGLNFRTGYSSTLKRKAYLEMIKSLQSFHLKHHPEIVHSVVDFDTPKKRRRTHNEYMYAKRTGKQTQKDILIETLEYCYNKSTNLAQFLDHLSKEGIQPYYRRDRLTGVRSNTGRKHRFRTLGFAQKLQQLDRQLQSSIDRQTTRGLLKSSQLSRLSMLKEIRGRSNKDVFKER